MSDKIRQMLRTLAEQIQANAERPEADTETIIESTRQVLALIESENTNPSQ